MPRPPFFVQAVLLACLVAIASPALAQQMPNTLKPGQQGGQPQGGTPPQTGQPVEYYKPPEPPVVSDDMLMNVGIGVGVFVVLVLLIVVAMKSQKKPTESQSSSDVIGGYRLANLMMTGQSSQVWETVEVASGRHFAMKILLPEKATEAEHRQLLFHEAEVGIKMSHPNVIRIVRLAREHNPPYFVMEFFPAGNLKIRIMHKKIDFIKEKAHDIFRQAATALAYMNASGWVHRDVKPDNIMVNSAGEVRLIDFALAQRIQKQGMFTKKRGKTAGTRSYMSPEQIRGEPLDGRADIYSFGATMYETVSGRPPFRASSPTELLNKHFTEKPISPQAYNKEITDEFAGLVLKMLAKKKEDRPKDFHEVLIALRGMAVFKGEAIKKPLAEGSA